jgi:hypothetical protein
MDDNRPRVRSLEEAEAHLVSVYARLDAVEKYVIDHNQRFDTLQTPWWKRIWFWFNGWPWYNLNGTQRPRPWHRGR